VVLCLTSWNYDPTETIPASTIAALLDRGFGADLATTDMYGWNTFFHFVLRTESPDYGEELNAARILLPVVGNILAKDRDGHTLFDRLKSNRPALPWKHEAAVLELSMDSRSFRRYGSYQQDLLYCALLRSGRYSLRDLPPLPAGPRFTRKYTPQHYRALLYLQTWDGEAEPTVLTRSLLSQDPLLHEERERAPAFHEWNLSDLSTMERRLEHATFVRRVQECDLDDEWSDTSAGDESDDLDSNSSAHSAEEDSEEPEDGWPSVPVEGEEGSGDSRSDWSDDLEEEGGVSVT
jgi:hypothetical protein